MLEELPEQDRHHPLEPPKIPQILDLPAIESARGAGMTMLAQNLPDGITSFNGPSNTTPDLEDFGDGSIEQESNPGGDVSRLRDISTETNSPEGQDRRLEKSAMDNVEEDMTRDMITLMDVDSDSEALVAGSSISHMPTIATARPVSMEVDSDVQKVPCSQDDDSNLPQSSTGPLLPAKTATEVGASSWQTLPNGSRGSTPSVDGDSDADEIDSDSRHASVPILKVRASRKWRTAASRPVSSTNRSKRRRNMTSRPTVQSYRQVQQPASISERSESKSLKRRREHLEDEEAIQHFHVIDLSGDLQEVQVSWVSS